MITSLIKKITETLFPSYCYLCKKEGRAICDDCLALRKRALDTPSPCITSIYSFKDPSVKKIIHAIKYFHRKDLIQPLTQEIVVILTARKQVPYVLIPIPMPRIRKYIRGYNHTEAIAETLSQQLPNTSVQKNLLLRSSPKKRQVLTKSRGERLKNQHNAFTVMKSTEGMNIILIDDVTTTGATLLEARRVLLARGAQHVEAFTLAH